MIYSLSRDLAFLVARPVAIRMALGVYGRGEPRWWRNAPASIAAPRCATPSRAAQCGPDRRGRPNALASIGFVPGAKARSAPQSRGLASLVRVTWCFDCSPHGSVCSTGRAEAVVGITCSKPAGRRCWVATAGDCTWTTRTRSNIWPGGHWWRHRSGQSQNFRLFGLGDIGE